MEHLVSPLHFVLEANRVLAEGGIFVARAPTTWPLHAEPWDFWRFSQHGWQGLLNAGTGFEILDICEFGESSIVPMVPAWSGGVLMATSPAPLFTGVVARKIGPASRLDRPWSSALGWGQYDPA